MHQLARGERRDNGNSDNGNSDNGNSDNGNSGGSRQAGKSATVLLQNSKVTAATETVR
ncbi:hypothetical protein MmiAt1_14820 [Methanimicrococcus sp. At1]|uniref:Uncharacterized protein n=1 Tax=Methanimicrococcus hacksteinii TaxID=3028293 RepID=A0ABU3VRW1_9EURY|nr:hypothetical protein [Methanimicrococcus sp. At1]